MVEVSFSSCGRPVGVCSRQQHIHLSEGSCLGLVCLALLALASAGEICMTSQFSPFISRMAPERV